MKSISGIYWI